MDCDELIDGLLSAQGNSDGALQTRSRKTVAMSHVQDQEEPDTQWVQKHHGRLAALVVGGQAKPW